MIKILLFTTLFFLNGGNKPEINPAGMYVLAESSKGVSESLNLKDDFTFEYTSWQKDLLIKGTWKIVDHAVVLETNEKLPIQKKWKIVSNRKCLKSRNKLAFYTICDC